MTSRSAGFTIIELMIALTIVAILLTVAAPSMRDLILNARMTGQANDLLTDLSVARAEAVKRGVPTAICTSNNRASCTASAWNQGWIIFSDGSTAGILDGTDAVIKVTEAIEGANDEKPNTIVSLNHETNAGAMWIGFRPSGVVRAGGGGPNVTFSLCDRRNTTEVGASKATNKGRTVTVSGTGRAMVQPLTCP